MRGAMVTKVVNQLLTCTDWSSNSDSLNGGDGLENEPLDYLVILSSKRLHILALHFSFFKDMQIYLFYFSMQIIDMPPGTGDIPITLCQTATLSGAVLVSTPHILSHTDVTKGIAMFQDMKVPIISMVCAVISMMFSGMYVYVCCHGVYGVVHTTVMLDVICRLKTCVIFVDMLVKYTIRLVDPGYVTCWLVKVRERQLKNFLLWYNYHYKMSNLMPLVKYRTLVVVMKIH